MQRTSGFVAGSVGPGFTVPPSRPPGSLRHLTHDLVALHGFGLLTLVRSFALSLWPHRPATGTTTTSADFSLRPSRRPFRHKARSPQVRTHTFTAQPPHLRHLALVTRALRSLARSPCLATPSMRFLFIGSRFTLHASFPRSVALTQLRFTLLTVTSLQRDLHPQVCAHAGRTKWIEGGLRPPSLPCATLLQAAQVPITPPSFLVTTIVAERGRDWPPSGQ
jgi:hypothetical protein